MTAPGDTDRTIVIVGAGIGGLTAALALAQTGWRVIVAERSERLSELGAGIQIGPNARHVLDKLGIGTAFAALACEPVAIDIRSSATGNLVTSVAGASFAERYGAPYAIIHRADLQAVLVEAVVANPAIELRLGATVRGLAVEGERVSVAVDGGEAIVADAVVAADGVWSTVRGTVAGTATPKPSGRTAWRALLPLKDDGTNPATRNRVGLWLGPNAHVVHYPVAHGTALNVVAIVEENWQEPGWYAPGDVNELAVHFHGWAIAARKLMAGATDWQKYALVSVDAATSWSGGRVTLLGDAAHAMLPFLAQGAAMAIEDAAVLADCLRGRDDIPAALAAYEAARKPRVAAVAAISERTGGQYHWRGLPGFARDTALHALGERMIFDRYDWIYRWRPDLSA